MIDLFNDSFELVYTLEQGAYLNQTLAVAIEKLKKLKQDFIKAKLDRKELQRIIQKFTTAKFDPGKAENIFWGSELETLKKEYAAECDELVREFESLRKKLEKKISNTRKGA